MYGGGELSPLCSDEIHLRDYQCTFEAGSCVVAQRQALVGIIQGCMYIYTYVVGFTFLEHV